ncbi:LysR family transcriptional regulator [Photobacterium ganghwense]|nr:LysR family transcriptional regulator [Photobacterium ganghwense]MBV1841907.1 LysR family transcriptional regulator [Photobacterium ganghwense]
MMRMPSTRELQAFLVTAEHLNFTVVAKHLNVTQGAVSRQILTLEDQLKVKLFHRHARGLSLTRKGNEFLPLVQQVMMQLQKAVEQVANEKLKIKLKAPSCVTSWLLPKLMSFQQAHPDIDVELTSAIMHSVNFSTEPFDAAICYADRAPGREGKNYLLFEEVLAPVCSPVLLQETVASGALSLTSSTPTPQPLQLDIDGLTQFTWLHATPQQTDWQLWLEQANVTGRFATQNQHFATLDLAVSAAIQGFGIAIGDVELARQDLAAGRLVRPHPLSVPSGKGYYLVRPGQSSNPSLDLLFDWLLAGR